MFTETASSPLSPAEVLERVRLYANRGDYFRAFDSACRALATAEPALRYRLEHQAVVALANAGALEQAEAFYAASSLATVSAETLSALLEPQVVEYILCLPARLTKERAFQAPLEQRHALLTAAAAAYEHAFEVLRPLRGGHYMLMNAAHLELRRGDRPRACELAAEAERRARAALSQLDSQPGRREGRFWCLATLIECAVLLDHAEDVGGLVQDACLTAGGDYRWLATAARSIDASLDILNPTSRPPSLKPPQVLHYVGHRIAAPGQWGRLRAEDEASVQGRIAAWLDGRALSSAYGSLAAGSDILFAEALLAREIPLHVILPFRVDDFIEVSVRPSGGDWVRRFEACMATLAARPETCDLRYANEGEYLDDDTLFAYASRLAMGLARLRARALFTDAVQCAVWNGEPSAAPAGTAVDVFAWRKLGLTTEVIAVDPPAAERPLAARAQHALGITRRPRAMLFGDFLGFSKLCDEQLPRFVDHLLGALAEVIERQARAPLFKSTWGDAIYLVYDFAVDAAACALEIQETIRNFDFAGHRLPASLSLRLGAHFGPVYAGHEPILGQTNYFGAHVSRAARIEPVTPPGCTYCTETFVAALEMSPESRFDCQYVGMTEGAKSYGAMRMFLLRRRPLDRDREAANNAFG